MSIHFRRIENLRTLHSTSSFDCPLKRTLKQYAIVFALKVIVRTNCAQHLLKKKKSHAYPKNKTPYNNNNPQQLSMCIEYNGVIFNRNSLLCAMLKLRWPKGKTLRCCYITKMDLHGHTSNR